MKLMSACKSDIGLKRSTNEDRSLVDPELGLFVVCDGMGGHAAGEVAAETACREITDYLKSHEGNLGVERDTGREQVSVEKVVSDAINCACGHLYEMAKTTKGLAGMGTTASLLLVVDGKAVLGHVGDSRVYLRRANSIELLTRDHTVARETSPGVDDYEVNKRRSSNVLTRCLGAHPAVIPDTLVVDLFPGDTYLLCTDGLSNYFESAGQVADFLKGPHLEAALDELLAFARSKGGADNVTAILLRVEGGEDTTIRDVQDQLAAMQSIPLFASLALRQTLRLVEICSVRTFEENEELVGASGKCEGLHVVLSGKLTLASEAESVELERGDYFGEVSLVREKRSDVAVVAEEAGKVMLLSREAFETLADQWPKLGKALQRNLLLHLTKRSHLPVL